MKKYIFILSAFFVLLSKSLTAQTNAYQQTFDHMDPHWSDHDDVHSRAKMEKGKFFITQKQNTYSYYADEVSLEDERDYSIETVATHISGSESGGFGLVFAGHDENNYYVFAISASGTYSMGYRNAGVYKPFIKPTESSAIKKGDGTANKLRIETAGDKIKLYINGHLINTVNMIDQPYGNDIGFIVEKAQTAAFDYLRVNYVNDPDKEIATQYVKQVVNQTKDTIKHVISPPVIQPVATVATPPGATAATPPASVVATLPATVAITGDTAKHQPNTAVNVVASQRIIADTARHNVAPVVKDTAKLPLSRVNNVAANQPDTTKQQFNPVINKPITLPIIEPVYHTDFSTGDQTGWALNQNDSVATTLGNGELRIVRKSKLWLSDAVKQTMQLDMTRKFLIETTVTHHSGGKYYGFGLEFGADSLQAYHFWISSSGYYSIAHTNNSGYIRSIKYRSTDTIYKGDSVKNKLAIEHKNGRLYFFINDNLVDNLPEIDFSGQQFGLSVCSSQNIGFGYLTVGYLDHAPLVVKTDTIAGPLITITSPKVTRGLKVVHADTLHVVGTARDAAGVLSVTVNGEIASVGMDGGFLADVPLIAGENILKVIAVSMDQRRSVYTFHLVKSGKTPPLAAVIAPLADPPLVEDGKYYALLIGEENYRDSRLQSLDGPVKDANKLRDALLENYNFTTENVKVLQNPSRVEVFNALNDIKNKVTSEDNVLIFYAGHGYYDSTTMQGYWLPVDADRDKNYTWISNSDIITNITAIKSKHTLLISDACFAGSIFRARGLDLAPRAIRELYKLPSRKAMTSSTTKEEVSDDSPFLKYLVKFLVENPDPYLSSEQLFERFKNAVINNSDATTQVPQFGELRGTGDEGGDFIFIKKNQ